MSIRGSLVFVFAPTIALYLIQLNQEYLDGTGVPVYVIAFGDGIEGIREKKIEYYLIDPVIPSIILSINY